MQTWKVITPLNKLILESVLYCCSNLNSAFHFIFLNGTQPNHFAIGHHYTFYLVFSCVVQRNVPEDFFALMLHSLCTYCWLNSIYCWEFFPQRQQHFDKGVAIKVEVVDREVYKSHNTNTITPPQRSFEKRRLCKRPNDHLSSDRQSWLHCLSWIKRSTAFYIIIVLWLYFTREKMEWEFLNIPSQFYLSIEVKIIIWCTRSRKIVDPLNCVFGADICAIIKKFYCSMAYFSPSIDRFKLWNVRWSFLRT